MTGVATFTLRGEKKPRVETRVRALVRAQIRDNMGTRDCCVIDVSTRGLLVTAARPPRRGDFVEVRIGRNTIVGHVKWSGDRRFGVALQDRISPAAVAEGGTTPIALQRSVSRARPRQSAWQGILHDPQVFGRFVTFAAMLLAMLVAGWFLYDMTRAGLAPMRDAVGAMHQAD